jgi:hypothetical protein
VEPAIVRALLSGGFFIQSPVLGSGFDASQKRANLTDVFIKNLKPPATGSASVFERTKAAARQGSLSVGVLARREISPRIATTEAGAGRRRSAEPRRGHGHLNVPPAGYSLHVDGLITGIF